MTEAEQIKLGNFKEHYAVIRKNIDAANDELGDILEKSRLARENYDSTRAGLTVDIEQLNKQKQSLIEYVKVEEVRIRHEHDIISASQKKVDNDIASHEEQVNKDSEQIKLLRGQVDLELSSKREAIKEYDKEIIARTKILQDTETKIKEVDEKVDLARKSLADIEKTIELSRKNSEQLKKHLSDKIEELDRQIGIKTKELNKIVSSFDVREKSLDAREARIEQKWNDARILYARANRIWTKLYPNRQLEDIFKD